MNIEELRKNIDKIDARIVKLIAERQAISLEIGKGKKKASRLIEDREREMRVLEHVRAIARDVKISPADVETIYKQIITASKKIQAVAVAYQGEPGAYTEEAAFRFLAPQPKVYRKKRWTALSRPSKTAKPLLRWCRWKIPSKAASTALMTCC